jgi:outer membrane protein TolC
VTIAQRALATSKKGLDAANESYRVRQALLAAQRATGVELVDAETELTRARIAALNARIDLRIANVELAHAIGADTK